MKNSKLKAALFVAGILISFGNVKAQEGFQVGVQGAPQLSYLVNVDDNDSDLYKTLNAVTGSFGLTSQYGFTENVGIGLDVLYSFQGDKYEWKSIERYKNLQYIKVPIMLTVSVPFGSDMMFLGKIGPQIDFLTDAKLLDKDGDAIKSDYSAAFEDYGLSAMISAGFGYMINDNVSIDLALRYDIGLTDAENKDYQMNIHNPFDMTTPAPASSPRAMTHNMTLGLQVGVRYLFL